jgi:vanillate O-demethylase ferredoxin subunit
MTESTLSVVVREKWNEAEGVVGLQLARKDGGALPSYQPGSHIELNLQNGLVRQYSLVGDSTDLANYEIGVFRDPQSRGGSAFVCETLNVGDALTISRPRCDFALAENQSRAILFAGGIGITPILSMATALSRKKVPFELHYGAKMPARMAFLNRIQESAFVKNCHLYFEADDENKFIPFRQRLWMPEENTHIYICGPALFIDLVRAAALESNWDPAHVHSESFRNTVSSEGGAFKVNLARSGKIIEVSATETIAEALIRHGVSIPLSCQEGVCGTCVTRFISGDIDHRDIYLSDSERAEEQLMTPCCSRARTGDLVLDL